MLIIIDNYDSFTYNLYQMVAKIHSQVIVIRNDKISVADLLAMQPEGLILSPGPGRPESAGICIDLLRSLPATLPLLGVCLGLQAIVYAFGGHICSAPELVHGKASSIFHQRNGLYRGLPLPFSAGRYHSLLAERTTLPTCLKIDAQTADGLIMGVHHQFLPIYGLQFHPESILTPFGTEIMHSFLRVCAVEQAGVLCA